jgi:hypothetical protein
MTNWKWPDARGWIGIGVFALSVMLLWMMKDRQLREDEFFQTIATVIIANGLMAVISWAYAATKGGGELADKNAAIVAESASAGVAAAGVVAATAADKLADGEPTEVKVVNPPSDPANVTDAHAAPVEELPEYAR